MLPRPGRIGRQDAILWVLLCFKLDQVLPQGKSLSGAPPSLYDAPFLEELPTQSRMHPVPLWCPSV